MRVIIASQFHYNAFKGGNEQHAHQVSLGLAQAGHDVTYLSSSIVSPHELRYRHLRLPVITFFNQMLLKKIPIIAVSELQHADVIHVFGFSPLLLQLLARAKSKAPKILTYPADTLPKNSFVRILSRANQQFIPHVCDCLLTTTTAYEIKLRERWPSVPIYYVPLMVPTHIEADALSKQQARIRIALNTTQKHVLCVASLSSHHYYKGVPILLKALSMLPQGIHLHLIGDGDQRGELAILSQKLGISSRITFHGSLNNEAMAIWYKAVDLVLLPSTSLSEGFGLSLLEAMYCQTPCLTTTIIGPAKYYAARKLCHLVKPNDPRALASALHSVLRTNNTDMIARAKAWANVHTTKAMTQKTLSIYKALLQSQKA